MLARHKYARIERERRFLLAQFPNAAAAERIRRITDRYLDGARLRLREQREEGGQAVFKLTQKLPAPGKGARQGLITTIYLTEEEFGVLSRLPAKQVRKTRDSVPPFGIDVFEDHLQGLVLAEAEFASAAAARALAIPDYVVREVSDDPRFTGGELARASRNQLRAWLAEFGIPSGS